MKTLKDVKVGETVTVAKLHGEGPVKRRIMDMGAVRSHDKTVLVSLFDSLTHKLSVLNRFAVI